MTHARLSDCDWIFYHAVPSNTSICTHRADKARLIANLIRGRNVAEAMSELTFSKKRGAAYYKQVLNSAIANAEEQDANVESLYISEARVDEGPPLKRWQPKDRGRAHPILKKTSHLHLSVEERS